MKKVMAKRVGNVQQAFKRIFSVGIIIGIIGTLVFGFIFYLLISATAVDVAPKTGITVLSQGESIKVYKGAIIDGNAYEYIETDDGRFSTEELSKDDKFPVTITQTMVVRTNTVAVIYYGDLDFDQMELVERILD